MVREQFEIQSDPEDVKKQAAGRKYLILAVVSLLAGTVLFAVFVTIIIRYGEDKRISESKEKQSGIYSSEPALSPYNQLQSSAIIQSTISIETMLSSAYENPSLSAKMDSKISNYISSPSSLSFETVFHSVTSYFLEETSDFSSPSSTLEIFSSFQEESALYSSIQKSEFVRGSTSSSELLPSTPDSSYEATYPMTSMALPSRSITSSDVLSTRYVTCSPDQYQCIDGACITISDVCDGKPDCPDGTDESPDCVCSSGQFQCTSGQCVSSSDHCDRFTQCQDKSDEYNCTNCVGFMCTTGLCLWTWTSQCNGVVDCDDLSDEKHCPFKPGFRRCNNGLWVKSDDWCNGLDDCYDNSDETQCAECGVSEVICNSSRRCIRREWVCDGHYDCVNGTDEDKCSNCSIDEFTCRDYTCVSEGDICDGVIDCPDKSDEENCVELKGNTSTSGLVAVQLRGYNYYICSTPHWTTSLSDQVCQYLGHEASSETSNVTVTSVSNSSSYLQLRDTVVDSVNSFIRHLDLVSSCDTDFLVSIQCIPKGCGEQKHSLVVAYIAGGDLVVSGKWPWVASLSYLGKPICGAVLISDQWLLTAGHCIYIPGSYDYSQVPFYIEVMLGSTKRSRDAIGNIRIKADRIYHHLNLTWTGLGPIYFDLALVHMERPVQFTPYIQPICLPDTDEKFGPHSNCYLAGWGLIGPDQELTVNDLREAKLKIWNQTECQDDRVPLEVSVPVNITLCAGYKTGILSGCKGDSGGPLMCQNRQGHWTVVGVMSSGPASCGISSTVSDRFTKISAFMEWIKNVTSVLI